MPYIVGRTTFGDYKFKFYDNLADAVAYYESITSNDAHVIIHDTTVLAWHVYGSFAATFRAQIKNSHPNVSI